MEYYLITFSSTHAAIAAQKYIEGKIIFHVMPTLREISSSCGISLKIESTPYETIKEYMKQFPMGDDMYKIYWISAEGIHEMII
ncbi:MAG: hypothetical protein K0R92_3565 [Lachnospiraceae bacterium]|jgi:hypothetical protein|nr:hypothetical protein [Lachnospiraceae bacterium]